MSDLDKAREWADRIRNTSVNGYPTNADCYSAAEVIQSLPDKWVDVEEVQEIIEEMESLPDTTRVSSEIAIATEAWKRRLEALLPSKLPTLADMTQEEREACKWMQCEIDGQLAGILARVDEQRGHIWVDSGHSLGWKLENITPLPDLPKLEWPGEIPRKPYLFGGTSSESDLPDMSVSEHMETPKSSIKPEDVPPNEPWLIEVEGQKAVGTRYQDYAVLPWSVAPLDGSFAADYMDSEVTLIHKLVAEPPALPEGMRLADHDEYGRVVVAPRANTHGEEFFYRLGEDSLWGASYGYRPTEEFTFLDGEA